MKILLRIFLTWLSCLVLSTAAFGERQTLLLISIDGLRPDYVTEAEEHGLKIPHLRQFIKDGCYASGVRGVLPTSTYPSHTAIMTGVAPAKHGIPLNHPFDPKFTNPDAWYWFNEDIRVPTLWTAAARAGLVTANISWPVAVGAEEIRFNIPEYNQTKTPEDVKMVRALASRSFMSELEKKLGPYAMDVKDAVPRDWTRTRYAVEIFRTKHPQFFTVHLASSDHLQHENGPFAPVVLNAITEIDKMIGEMATAARADNPNTVICVVSDHGFAKVDHHLRLFSAFVKAGLITLKASGEIIESAGVKDWIAMPSSAGGSAAIIMKNPKDEAARAKVAELLKRLAADSKNGIENILDRDAITQLGGTADAQFWVDMKIGYSITSTLKEPLAAAVSVRGAHGYSPSHPELNALFLIAGPGIRHGVDLGIVDMRSVAPTLAKIMDVPFPTAELPALPVSE